MAFDYAHGVRRVGKRGAGERAARSVSARRRGMIVRLGAGEMLFAPGEAKHDLVYRIRKGRVQVSGMLPETKPGGAPTRIYCAGEFAGLGFLETHAAFAHALEAVEVIVWSRADFERVGEQKPDYRAQQDEAVRLEFVWRRAQVAAEASAGQASR